MNYPANQRQEVECSDFLVRKQQGFAYQTTETPRLLIFGVAPVFDFVTNEPTNYKQAFGPRYLMSRAFFSSCFFPSWSADVTVCCMTGGLVWSACKTSLYKVNQTK